MQMNLYFLVPNTSPNKKAHNSHINYLMFDICCIIVMFLLCNKRFLILLILWSLVFKYQTHSYSEKLKTVRKETSLRGMYSKQRRVPAISQTADPDHNTVHKHLTVILSLYISMRCLSLSLIKPWLYIHIPFRFSMN